MTVDPGWLPFRETPCHSVVKKENRGRKQNSSVFGSRHAGFRHFVSQLPYISPFSIQILPHLVKITHLTFSLGKGLFSIANYLIVNYFTDIDPTVNQKIAFSL
jgi:hypothetical protein